LLIPGSLLRGKVESAKQLRNGISMRSSPSPIQEMFRKLLSADLLFARQTL
jgi:hypothetical protein